MVGGLEGIVPPPNNMVRGGMGRLPGNIGMGGRLAGSSLFIGVEIVLGIGAPKPGGSAPSNLIFILFLSSFLLLFKVVGCVSEGGGGGWSSGGGGGGCVGGGGGVAAVGQGSVYPPP